MAAAQRGIGRTFQNNALFHRMSVLDNVLTGLTRLGRCSLLEIAFRVGRHPTERRAFRQRAEEIIGFLEIGAHRDTVVGGLPYGLQKRVEMARALVASPTLLLLDEPMAGMNADEKVELSRAYHRGQPRLRHNRRADRARHRGRDGAVAPCRRARLRPQGSANGTPAEVRRNPDVIAAYLGTKH